MDSLINELMRRTDLAVRFAIRDGVESWAVYSCPGEGYRYHLRRVWDAGRPRMCWVMLNPSTATEVANDPTLARCETRAMYGRFGGFDVLNLYAFRTTYPVLLYGQRDPVGPVNDEIIWKVAMQTVEQGGVIVCGWGEHGGHLNRHADVMALLAPFNPLHLGLTKKGMPRHPLYRPYREQPRPFEAIA